MYEKMDKIVDLNLPILFKKENLQLSYSDLVRLDGKFLSPYECPAVARYMDSKNLIHWDGGQGISLTEFGAVIAEQGWINYLDLLKEEEEARANLEKAQRDYDKEKERLELDNLKWNTRVNKWMVKSRFLPYIVSAISVGVSIYALVESKSANTEVQSVKLNQEAAIESKIDSISTSIQTKKDGSLPIPKILSDSLTTN